MYTTAFLSVYSSDFYFRFIFYKNMVQKIMLFLFFLRREQNTTHKIRLWCGLDYIWIQLIGEIEDNMRKRFQEEVFNSSVLEVAKKLEC